MQLPPANWRVPPTRPQPQLPDDELARPRGGGRWAPRLPDWAPRLPRGGGHWAPRLLGLIAGLVVLAGLAQTPPGHSLMRLTGLTKAPVAYAALYFTDPGGLPSSVPSGHVQLGVSFAVHNAAQTAGSYKWTIQLVHGSRTAAATSGTTNVAGGGTKAESRTMTTLCQSGTLEVIVRLTAPAQSVPAQSVPAQSMPAESIHFRATCDG